jgi:hypothetical protein
MVQKRRLIDGFLIYSPYVSLCYSIKTLSAKPRACTQVLKQNRKKAVFLYLFFEILIVLGVLLVLINGKCLYDAQGKGGGHDGEIATVALASMGLHLGIILLVLALIIKAFLI